MLWRFDITFKKKFSFAVQIITGSWYQNLVQFVLLWKICWYLMVCWYRNKKQVIFDFEGYHGILRPKSKTKLPWLWRVSFCRNIRIKYKFRFDECHGATILNPKTSHFYCAGIIVPWNQKGIMVSSHQNKMGAVWFQTDSWFYYLRIKNLLLWLRQISCSQYNSQK